MALLAGIGYFDGRSLSRVDISSLRALPGQRQVETSSAGNVACAGSSVVWDDTANCELFGWDGRFDNRHQADPAAPTAAADEVAARSLYVSRGVQGLRSLVGDWSLAIWDKGVAEVILASDYAGVRPLYYHASNERVIWSSSLQHLTWWTGLTELDLNYAADFLIRGWAAGCTPIKGIQPVPSGSAVRIGRGTVRCERFWKPPIDTHIHYTDERQYEEQLRALFQEAVRARLRESHPVCAELSGGLDSSSIVCMANSLIASGSVPASSLVTFSYQGDDPSDQEFWRHVERACCIETTNISISDYPFASPACVGKGAPLAWESRFVEVQRRMSALGSKMLLTGRIGDLVMGNWFDGSEQFCDAVFRNHWRSAFTLACRWSQIQQQTVHSVIRTSRMLSKGVWPSPALVDDSLAPWLRKLARAREEQRSDTLFWKSVAIGRRDRLRALLTLLDSRSLECPEPLTGLSCSHPFAHLPLVEFMLSIPAHVVYRPGEPRRLMRRAFSKLLPRPVLERRSKTSYGSAFRRALYPMASQLLRENRDLRVCDAGYVAGASLTRRLQRFLDGLECGEAQLRNILIFEFWLRNRETNGRPPLGADPAFERTLDAMASGLPANPSA